MDFLTIVNVVVGLTIVPLGIDLLGSFAAVRPSGRHGRVNRGTARGALIASVSLIALIALSVFWQHILPYHAPVPWSWSWIGLVAVALYLFAATILTHILAVLVSAGASSTSVPRSHFCKTCGHHVRDRDHHCVYTGNCVGRFNRTYFILFLLHLLAGSTFAVVLCISPFRACVLTLGTAAYDKAACAPLRSMRLALVPSLMVWAPIAPLVTWHVLIVRADTTTAAYIRHANSRGLASACRRLLQRPKALRDNHAWQLIWRDFVRADELVVERDADE